MDLCALLRSPASSLFLRPAFDRLAVPALTRLYFPLSRAWAAGLAADGDVDRLIAQLPALEKKPGAARRALRRLAPRAEAYGEATRRWQEALFGGSMAGTANLGALEAGRASAAQALMAGRLAFLGAHIGTPFDAVAWSIAPRDEVMARHGHRLTGVSARFPLPDAPPPIEESRSIEGNGFSTNWLRAPSRVGDGADTLWARVERPLGEGPHPVLIFTHGIAMETEFWQEVDGPAQRLAAAGLVVVRPEGPFHGRRRVPGSYGGEPVWGRGPMGLLDYFEAHVRELGILTAWARRTFGAAVAVGGVSLGALTAQLAVTAASHWRACARPDAAFLVTTSDSIVTVAQEGGLPVALGTRAKMAESGWTDKSLGQWAPLLDPVDLPAVPADRIVMVLGRRDTLTPYPQGQRLARRWGVTGENLFLHDLGHFTASLSLYRDFGPFDRLRAVLAAV